MLLLYTKKCLNERVAEISSRDIPVYVAQDED